MNVNPRELESLRPFVRGLCYRMTGSLADAEDLVQDTFVRVVERPPPSGELRPWVTRVAVNLARDAYRRRKRVSYTGVWLPAPVDDESVVAYEPAETVARYDLAESASLAFLVALEALSPRQRAVLLLCDVLDYSVAEAAKALEMTEGNVKVVHHRARKRMEGYDAAHAGFERGAAAERTGSALARFASAMATRDVAALEALFSEDAVMLSDGGGVFRSALKPLAGASKIVKFLLGVSRFHEGAAFAVTTLNGLPAVVGVSPDAPADVAPRHVTVLDVDAEGRIRRFISVLAPAKLGHVAFPS
jgi:RNA polymerase sigma-70 factor (ECF subfamily)